MTNQVGSQRWVEAYADVLYRYARSRVGDPSLAEDLVQDTLLAALQAQRSFRGDSRERTWLIGILRHKVVDHYRAARTRRETTISQVGAGDDAMESIFDEKGRWRHRPQGWQVDAGRLLEDREFWDVLHGCLRGLPDRPREVFVLRVMEQQETGEICKVLGMTATNLWVALHRARVQLRHCLEARWFTEPKSGHHQGANRNAQL